MDNYRTRRKWQSDSSATINENELYNISYENDPSKHNSVSCIAGSLLNTSSKENVQLSLELELTESLKHIISSPRKCDSALVDVTIVRPEQFTDSTKEMEMSTIRTSEVRKLIASIERQKENRKKLIEECKSILSGDKPQENTPKRNRMAVRSEERKGDHYGSGRRAPHRTNKTKTKHPDHETKHPYHTYTQEFNCLTGECMNGPYSANALKVDRHALGSLKHDGRSVEAGDHSKIPVSKSKRTHKELRSKTSDTTNQSLDVHYQKQKPEPFEVVENKNPQVYTTVKTFDQLRKQLTCQNRDRREPEDKTQTPCLCQHCGMIGLLVESQKRPFTSNSEDDPSCPKHCNHKNKDRKINRRAIRTLQSKSHVNKQDTRDIQQYEFLICELSDRVRALEVKMKEQEERAVPKEYFKKVINKIVSYMSPRGEQNLRLDHSPTMKTISTQYSLLCFQKEIKSRRRNIEVHAHPVLISQDHKAETTLKKTISVITDQIIVSHADKGTGQNSVSDIMKPRDSTLDSFWKWGGEIIKPGVDLKDKIVSLLEDKLTGKVHNVPIRDGLKLKLSSEKIIYLSDMPKEISFPKHKDSTKRFTCKMQSSNCSDDSSFKKFLDIMSNKIYNEQVRNKPNTRPVSEPKYYLDERRAANDNIFRKNIQARKENEEKVSDTLRVEAIIADEQNSKTFHYENKNFKEKNDSSYDSSIGATVPEEQPNISLRHTGSIPPTCTTKIPVSLMQKGKHLRHNENQRAKNSGSKSKLKDSDSKSNVVRDKEESVCVTYINPKAKDWDKQESRSMVSDAKEYLDGWGKKRKRSKSKVQEKEGGKHVSGDISEDMIKLMNDVSDSNENFWRSLWSQAKKFGKSKQDKVTIQIPTKLDDVGKESGETVKEMELTIGELEVMATKFAKKVDSDSSFHASHTILVEKHKKNRKRL